jgi:hypothetical protein
VSYEHLEPWLIDVAETCADAITDWLRDVWCGVLYLTRFCGGAL